MLCNDLQRIDGRRRLETFANFTPKNGPVAAGRIAPGYSNFNGS